METGPPGTGSGLVVGRFDPPHRGHQYLIDFARYYVEDLTLVVVSRDGDRAPGKTRAGWLRELAPAARVMCLETATPNEDAAAWAAEVARAFGERPDFVFGSTPAGRDIAAATGGRYIPVDQDREVFAHVPPNDTPPPVDCVGPVKRIVIAGAESTGKSWLAQRLARHFGTLHCGEYAREHVAWQNNFVTYDDHQLIARGHLASEEALARQANGLLFVDTDAVMTTLYCDFLYGRCSNWVRETARQRPYDLTLVLDCDVPWRPDPQRSLETPEERCWFRDRLMEVYEALGRRWVLVSGNWDERFERAVGQITEVLEGSFYP